MALSIKEQILFFLICLFGILLRFYNHSYDDLWYDEIISFWVADPNLSFQETLRLNNLIDPNTPFFPLILKLFFSIFGYSVESGRLFSVIVSSLSMFSVAYLSWVVAKNNSFLLTLFLISFNIFLISFSQEVRVYSLLFFASSIFLIFFFHALKKKRSFFNLVIYFLSCIFLISLHPFALIIFFSSIAYLSLQYIKKREKYLFIHLINILIFAFAYYFYFTSFLSASAETRGEYFWMTNPDIGFYTNFFFSSFFGSRLMGVLFLVLLIALLIKNYKKIKNVEPSSLLVIIIFLSYFLPILFGYIYEPLLVNRYIIFVLIPVLIIISTFIYNLKNNFFKNLIIFLTILATIGNHFTEQTFKQFFNERVVSKPQYTEALIFINNSEYKNYILKAEKMKNKKATIDAVNHYITYLSEKNKLNVKFIPDQEMDKIRFLWHLCFQDFNGKNCKVGDVKKEFKVIEKKNFNNVEIKLLEITI